MLVATVAVVVATVFGVAQASGAPGSSTTGVVVIVAWVDHAQSLASGPGDASRLGGNPLRLSWGRRATAQRSRDGR